MSRNSQVSAKNFQIRANDYATSSSAITLKSYTQAENGNVQASTYDLYFPPKNPVYKNGVDGDLNPSNKTFMYNAVTGKYEWGDSAGATLFIQGQTITEQMDEHGSALTVAREVPLVPGDPGYLDPSDPSFVQKYKVEYKFTDRLTSMQEFSSSTADTTRPQISAASGLYFDWTSAVTPTPVTGGDGSTYYTNEDKALVDKVVLQTNQERGSEDIVVNTFHNKSNLYDLTAVTAAAATYDESTGDATYDAAVTDIVSSAADSDVAGQHSTLTVTLDKNIADLSPEVKVDTWLQIIGGEFTTGGELYQVTSIGTTSFSVALPAAIADTVISGVADKTTYITTLKGFSKVARMTTSGSHFLAVDQYVKYESGLADTVYSSTDPVTLLKVTYDGTFKATPDGYFSNKLYLTYKVAPVSLSPATGTLKKFLDAPTKESSKIQMEPSNAMLKHYTVDQDCSGVGASRNKLSLNVAENASLSRHDNVMLPYQSEWMFSKTTKLAEWDSYETGYKGETWVDEAEKITKLAALGITKPSASEEDDPINQGYLRMDNCEKKLETDFETIEFGGAGHKHRLFVGPDADGNSRLFIQKYNDSTTSWVGADVIIDQNGLHTATLSFDVNFIADSSDPSYDGKMDVSIQSITGTFDHIHLYLDDANLQKNANHLKIGTGAAKGLSGSSTLDVASNELTATFQASELDNVVVGDFLKVNWTAGSDTDQEALAGVYAVTFVDAGTAVAKFATSGIADGSYGISEITVKHITKVTKVDPGYAGVHKIVAYCVDATHTRVSEFSSTSIDTSEDSGASGVVTAPAYTPPAVASSSY